MSTREKHTDIENVLPPIADLVIGQPHTTLRYIDLDGGDHRFQYRDLIDKDPYPIPMPVDREGYCTLETSHQYWASGYCDWMNVEEAIKRFWTSARPPEKLYDFGCATGRFLRHVMTFSDLEPHGSDLAPANVNWVKRHLPDQIKVVSNSAKPELPFADGSFDIVTAFSVFTHIDEGEADWLQELGRVVRPDGLLYLTIQNQATWDMVNDRPRSYERMEQANSVDGNIPITRELFAAPMPEERIVMRMSAADVYNCNVWHTNDYIRQHWSRDFEILQIADNAHTAYQSPVIMQPRQ